MALTDRGLSRSLRLSAWPCWEHATARDVVWMEWTARNILQPVIDRWGPLTISSWKRWARSGCREARTGDHEDPATVDFVPDRARISDVHNWMGAHIVEASGTPLYGSLIDERDHIHVTRRGVGTRAGETEFLVEPVEGEYHALTIPHRISGAALATAVAVAIYAFTRRAPP